MVKTGFFFTDVVNFVRCPSCGKDVKEECVDPGGSLSKHPHFPRMEDFMKTPHFDSGFYKEDKFHRQSGEEKSQLPGG